MSDPICKDVKKNCVLVGELTCKVEEVYKGQLKERSCDNISDQNAVANARVLALTEAEGLANCIFGRPDKPKQTSIKFVEIPKWDPKSNDVEQSFRFAEGDLDNALYKSSTGTYHRYTVFAEFKCERVEEPKVKTKKK